MTDNPDGKPVQVVINIDDIGMCHGANLAFVDLSNMGRCDSGSAMVPCPWFSDIVDMATRDSALRVGIHLTLNAEKSLYRWRPLTGARPSSGLVDRDGYFWRRVSDVRANAHPEAVEEELRAQIDVFLATGLVPSYMDAHMGTALAPEFYDIYKRLAADYRLTALYPRSLASFSARHNLGDLPLDYYDGYADRLEQDGKILADRVLETPWHLEAPVEGRYRALFTAAGPGLNFFALHANARGEIEMIEPESARIRVEEYDYLKSDAFGDWLETQNFQRGILPA